MNWTFIVVRDNLVERVVGFHDFWTGCQFTDSFIRSIDKSMVDMDMPAYNRGEFYRKNDLTVGLYKVC